MKQYTTHKTNRLLLSNALSVQNKNYKTEHKTKQITYATLCWFKNKQTNKMKHTQHKTNKLLLSNDLSVQNKTKTQLVGTTCFVFWKV